MLVEFVSANPTGPLHVGHGRQAALGDAICNLYATQGWDVYREFYYNDAGVQIATLATCTQLRAKGFKPGDAEWPEAGLQRRLHRRHRPGLPGQEDRQVRRPRIHRQRRRRRPGFIRQFAVAYLRHEQDLDLKAFEVQFDNYYLESSLYTSGKVEADRQAAAARRQDLRAGRRAVAASPPTTATTRTASCASPTARYTYFVPDVAYHITKWERGFPRS